MGERLFSFFREFSFWGIYATGEEYGLKII